MAVAWPVIKKSGLSFFSFIMFLFKIIIFAIAITKKELL